MRAPSGKPTNQRSSTREEDQQAPEVNMVAPLQRSQIKEVPAATCTQLRNSEAGDSSARAPGDTCRCTVGILTTCSRLRINKILLEKWFLRMKIVLHTHQTTCTHLLSKWSALAVTFFSFGLFHLSTNR